MTTQREYIYKTLSEDLGIQSRVGDRIFQGSSMLTAQVEKPFLVYHLGNDTDEQLSEVSSPHRQFFQIYVHDVIGDYSQIDEIIKLVKDLLRARSNAGARVIVTRYLETSQDLRDEVLDTIFRYMRFQLVMS